jgi:hypothetical protein
VMRRARVVQGERIRSMHAYAVLRNRLNGR